MNMEVWLFYVVLGLVLDIFGIWILAKPLLGIVFTNEEGWNKRLKEILDDYQIETKNYEGRKEGDTKNTDTFPSWFDYSQLRAYVYSVFNKMLQEKKNQREMAFFGLMVITLGFLSQILGNIIKP